MLGLRSMITSAIILVPLELTTVTISTFIALPFTLAIAPQKMVLQAKYLETEYQNLKDSKGQPITEFFANKGL